MVGVVDIKKEATYYLTLNCSRIDHNNLEFSIIQIFSAISNNLKFLNPFIRRHPLHQFMDNQRMKSLLNPAMHMIRSKPHRLMRQRIWKLYLSRIYTRVWSLSFKSKSRSNNSSRFSINSNKNRINKLPTLQIQISS